MSYKRHIQPAPACPVALELKQTSSTGVWGGLQDLLFFFLFILQKDYHVRAEVLVSVSVCESAEQRWNVQATALIPPFPCVVRL